MRNIVTKFIISLVCIFLTNTIVLAKVSVPFTMTESLFNDGSVVVNSAGTTSWGHPEIDGAGLLGVCVGKVSVNVLVDGGLDWNDKYVDIAFDGVPDKLSFSGESSALSTGIEWYVKESSNGSSWSSKIWTADTRMVNDVSIQLSSTTRYVRLCYSGNLKACFSEVTITSRYRLKVISNGETIRDEYLSAGTALSIQTPTDIPSCKVFDGWDQEVPSTMPAEDLTLTAQFSSEKYTSTFQLSNAELGVTLSDFTQTFDCEASVSVESPSLKGYTFQGWSPSLPTVATAAMDGVTYVAQWIHNLYQYKVYTDDANNPFISEQFHYEDAIAPLETPVRDGYDFQGWDAENPTTMPDHDVTIRALWEQKSHRFVVYFDDADSTVSTLHYGDPITPPATPFRHGFTFDGWDNEIPSFMPDHDVVIRANWVASSYRLVVYLTESDSTVTNKEYGEELSPLETPSRRGYVFVQWSVDLPATMPAADVIVRAIWQKSTYTITLMSDDEVFYTKSFGYQDTVDMSGVSNPSKEGYKFIGWNLEFPTYMPDENLTFEAVWRIAPYLLILEKDIYDPSQNDTLSFDYKEPITGVLDPERIGYTFTGWSPALPDSMPAKNVTVTARWTQNTYRYVVYNTDDDSTVVVLRYGDELPVLKTPSYRPGYTFERWDVEQPATMPADNLTIRAIWSQNTYRYVVYRTENDSVETLYHYQDTIPALETPSLSGYVFEKWDKEPISLMPDADFVIRATWSLAEYQLILTKGLDFIPEADTISILYKSIVSVADPSHEGYTFEGWTPALPDSMPANDFLSTAKWSKNKYRYVVYFTESDSLVENLFYGETLSPLEDQSRTGFTFEGWDKEQPATMPAADLTIKAVWKRNTYKLELLVDESVYFTQTFEYGDSIQLTDYTDPSKPGYNFEGWSDEFPAIMPARDLQYTSQWSAKKYSLVIIHDLDQPSLNDTFYYYCDESVLPVDPLPKEGFSFDGWNDEFPTKMLARNMILVAQWKANTYTISFMNADTIFLQKKYQYGETIDYRTLTKPTREGYFFLGWGTAPVTMPAEDVELNAQWSANAYSIVVVNDMDDASQNDTIYYEYGTTIAPLSTPIKEGYSFEGWDVDLPATMPDNDLKVVAKWKINTYTLTTLVNCKPKTYSYTYGNSISLTDPLEEGYEFDGWSDQIPAMMPGNNLLLIADMRLLKYNFITIVDEDTTIVSYSYKEPVEKPADPEKEGFTFLGWIGTIPAEMPSKDVLVIASWKRNTYTASFVVDEDTSIFNYSYEDTIKVPKVTPKEGYSFITWDKEVPTTMPAENLLFTAEFTPNNYYLVVISDDDTLSSKYTYGSEIAEVEEPVKVGYTFDGWNKQIPATMPAYNDTIIAKWLINSYTVTWIDNDTVVETYQYGEPVKVKDDPVREGYTFLEWDREVPATMPAEDRVLNAVWSLNSYEITFVNGENVETYKYSYGDTIHLVDDPKKVGYEFAGWSPVVPAVMPDSSLSVEAQWTAVDYQFVAIVDEDTVVAHQYHYMDSIQTLDEPVKEGYAFAGWLPTVPEVMPAGDVTVEAQWSLEYYNLVKIVNQDTVSIVYGYGESVAEIAEPTPEKGYTFVGWSDSIPTNMPAHDVEIVALWESVWYDLTIDVDSQLTTYQYHYGDTVAALAEPEKEGYLFAGWSDEVPVTMPAENVTLQATWIQSHFILSLVDEDTTRLEYSYGQTIEVEDPQKEGFTFQSWMPELPATMPSHDVLSEAMWTPNTYSLAVIVDGDTTVTYYNYQQKVATLADPEKEGYTFRQWSDTVPETMPAQDLYLTALFDVNNYTMTWQIGEDSVLKESYAFGDTINVPVVSEREGYQFEGWSDTVPVTMPATDVTRSAVWATESYHVYVVVATDTFTYEYRYGEAVQALIMPGVVGYTFAGWSDTLPAFMPNHDITITADLQPNEYNMVIDYGDSTVVITYFYNDTIPAIEDPEKEGYTFVGWSNEVPELMPNKNVKLEAIWERNNYQFVTIVDKDTTSQVYGYGELLTVPEIPEKEGYKVKGWSDSIPATMPAKDLVVTALYEVRQYGLTIDDGTLRVTKPYSYGDTIEKIEDPTKEGYHFVGWDTEIPVTMPDTNLVIVALWEPNSYDMTFIADDDTVVVTYKYGEEVSEITVGDKEGYSFDGWNPAVPATMPAEDVMVNVVWKLNTHDFTYITSKQTVTESYAYGDSVRRPSDPTRKGYRFVGWSDSIPTVMPDSSVTVEAQWEAKLYKIRLVQDGDTIRTLEIAYGDSVVLPDDLFKLGYRFEGWNREIPAVMPAKNMTFVAHFEPIGKMKVYTKNSKMIVYGLHENSQFFVTDELGRLVYMGKGTYTEIPLKKGGVYVVRSGREKKKVIVQ